MPLPDRIVRMLARNELKVSGTSNTDYLDKLPTLDSSVFPDEIYLWNIHQSGGEEGRKLHTLLEQAGLSEGQRAGVTHLLDSFSRVEDNNLTLGDIRALSEEEMIKLRGHYGRWGAKPSVDSIKKIKKLFG